MFDWNEVKAWEEKVEEKVRRRMYKHEKRYVDPRKEALLDFRRQRRGGGIWHFNETPTARRLVQRRFRAYCRQLMHKEQYHNPVPHEYKTYGWETW